MTVILGYQVIPSAVHVVAGGDFLKNHYWGRNVLSLLAGNGRREAVLWIGGWQKVGKTRDSS